MFPNVQIIGSYPFIAQQRTGLFSLDLALSNRGVLGAPMRTIYEVYGYPNSGKSTLCYYLAGKLSSHPEITICDLEMADLEYVRTAVGISGFQGAVRLIDVMDAKQKQRTHEQMMMDMCTYLETTSGAAILDSVGAIQPIAEAAGDFGEAFVGKRAKLVAQVARALSGDLRIKEEDAVAFVINHTHQIIGGRGHTTAGGETLKYMAGVRIMIWTEEVIKDTSEEKVLGFLAAGQVEKLRFGGRGRSFNYYIVPGLGVHAGASAMFDCFALGLAKRDSVVKLDGKSMGYLKKDLLEYAMTGKSRKFEPFQDALVAYEETLRYEEKKDDTDKRKGKKGSEPVDEVANDAESRE
jgi:RecA/RadA recombinase